MPTPATLDLLRHIEANNLAAATTDGRLTESFGPFLAVAHPTNDMIWLSYAVPVSAKRHEADVHAAIAPMRQWFRDRNRRMRYEILEPLWPDLEPQLVAAGVELQGRMPLMIMAPEDLKPRPVPAGVTIEPVTADCPAPRLKEIMRGIRRSFGELRVDPTDQEVTEHLESLALNRYRMAAAYADGAPVAAGSMSVGNDELVGIATWPEHQRRGVGAAVSAFVLDQHFKLGGQLAWLSAADATARLVYERVGFRMVGDQVNMMDPEMPG